MITRSSPAPGGTHRDLAVLDRDECFALLRSHYVGRIGLSVAALPVVVPVNFTMDQDRVVMCSEPGLKLQAARQGVVACLEIDDFDPLTHSGWSVLVTGRLAEMTDAQEITRAQRLPLAPWAPMSDPHFVTLSTELVSGRSLRSV
jgi:nitroimidazol reductase NimA-like FMN-containing flavoprotein (pyridoxamine 5'-phosphate oxidase superfamily)